MSCRPESSMKIIKFRAFIKTSVIQARSSEDRKDPNVEKAHQRTRRLVSVTNTENVPDSSQTRSCHESERFNVGIPVIDHDNLDFKIPGLPHSVVKHAKSTSFRELIQKIENHPGRHALQQDLRQNQSFNPLSPESKNMIHDVGNIESCELLDMESETQCKVCFSYWDMASSMARAGISSKRLLQHGLEFMVL